MAGWLTERTKVSSLKLNPRARQASERIYIFRISFGWLLWGTSLRSPKAIDWKLGEAGEELDYVCIHVLEMWRSALYTWYRCKEDLGAVVTSKSTHSFLKPYAESSKHNVCIYATFKGLKVILDSSFKNHYDQIQCVQLNVTSLLSWMIPRRLEAIYWHFHADDCENIMNKKHYKGGKRMRGMWNINYMLPEEATQSGHCLS